MISDLVFSFYQHLQMSLDGDIAGVVLPSEWYSRVLEDPFGISVWRDGATYAATNRFFLHAAMAGYFKTAPFLLQVFTDPVSSLYWSSAIIKTLVQAGLIAIMSYLTGSVFNTQRNFWVVALILTPLFQTFGYNMTMGVIEKSVTYFFFYAFPALLTLVFVTLLLKQTMIQGFRLASNVLNWAGIFALLIVLSFCGPLIPPILLIFTFLTLALLFSTAFQQTNGSFISRFRAAIGRIPQKRLCLFMLIAMLNVYSMYIGFSNAENGTHTLSLAERYKLMPLGLWELLTTKLGFPLLIVGLMINFTLLVKVKTDIHKKLMLRLSFFLLAFSLIYLLLLPCGGYRDYRPLIIRRDIFLPITLIMFFLFSMTATWLLLFAEFRKRNTYIGFLTVFLLYFFIADMDTKFENAGEKQALYTISNSKESIVVLPFDGTVLSWKKITDIRDSETNARMLQIWNITKTKKQYYQQ